MSGPSDQPVSVSEFGVLFQRFMQATIAAIPLTESALGQTVREHLGAEPDELPSVTEDFEMFDQPNVQVALDDLFGSPEYQVRMLGLNAQAQFIHNLSLSAIAGRQKAGVPGWQGVQEGPIEYANVHLQQGRVLRCIQCALMLIARDEDRLVGLLMGPREHMGPLGLKVRLQLMSSSEAAIDAFLRDLRDRMVRLNVYRGHVLSLGGGPFGGLRATFHELPHISREQIILPPGVLERLDRQTIVFADHAERLRAQGRHIKRGVLLYGPPGTGKTLTIMYLAAHMRGRTTILVTGGGMGLIPNSCALARRLQPATVVIEDVDLIAEDRTRAPMGAGPLLFELLNEMDGLKDDADVMFLLTSNRPDILEPALAARPGRVDDAIELPLPDAECRRRLFDLYRQGLSLSVPDVTPFVERTQGVTAAFIKELMRRAALRAAVAGAEDIDERELDSALDDLLAGGRLAQRLLGVMPGS